ncbi:MAG: xanthine dehydrogenase accessory protein XdhC [Bdellovibrionales bacterium]|nr:xanthine dehydrogenase accessory protein XdhC [Bdellovibrionales bacterium]
MSKEILERIHDLQKAGRTFVVVTLVKTKGSAPQEVGAKILVDENGYIDGTVGGGKVEERVIAHAKGMIKLNDAFDYADWNLQTDIKMTCGGVVSFFFERVQRKPTWEIAIFGAGHVSQEVVRTLLKLECSITCIDPREDWLNKLPDHHKLKKIHTDDMKDVVKTLRPGTFIASMTMGHAFDLPVLLEAMKSEDFPYLGVIGSDSKSSVLRSDLKKNGADESKIQKLHCPIGEPIGNNTPAEIAISIVAQLIKERDHLLVE